MAAKAGIPANTNSAKPGSVKGSGWGKNGFQNESHKGDTNIFG
jgi:hypothetical protein